MTASNPQCARQPGSTYTGRVPATLGSLRIATAIRIAHKYPSRPPTVDELEADFTMSRSTAYRWRAAFVDAMGLHS